jgi:photosystem II stability/assembly factor-like uncharacterized protein
MRPLTPLLGAVALLAGLAAPGRAAELRHLEDACLRAVQFIDAREGWAVGDDGAIWHSLNGGKDWERQPSGVRASLRALHFLDPCVGWVVGREELPAGGSAGVVLYTSDGGVNWKRLLVNALPGFHVVRFVDEKTGYLVGDGSDQHPTGVFATTNGGRTWQPLPGPRCPSWLAADFNKEGGALAGAWNRLATVRRAGVSMIDMDTLGGRNLRGLQLRGDGGVAVGQGGLVLLAAKGQGSRWHYADLKLPAEARAAWDFHAVGGTGPHIWAVGRPGSVALHSPDGGKSWEVVRTGCPLALHGIFFRDEKAGWAVGELGTILHTTDGGKTWQVRHKGGECAAVLCIHARARGFPLDTVALLGGEHGYLTAGVRITSPEPASAALARAGDADRLAAAFRAAGGAGAEMLWQFPVASHQAGGSRAALIQRWDALHGDRAAEQMLRQLVLALRTWRPAVVLIDEPGKPGALPAGNSSQGLVAEGVREAFRRAGDPSAYPEQLRTLGLQPWQPARLFAVCAGRGDGQVTLDLTAFCPTLDTTVREFAADPAALLAAGVPLPDERHYRLLESAPAGLSANPHDLMAGLGLACGGPARRPAVDAGAPTSEQLKAARSREQLRTFATNPSGGALSTPERLLSRIGPTLEGMSDGQAAPAAFAVATAFARNGQWALAREAFLLVAERYPAHPLALDACRWLVMHNASSEARRRHEMGQFIVAGDIHFAATHEKVGAKPKVVLPDKHLRGHELPSAPQKGPRSASEGKQARSASEGNGKPARPAKIALPPPQLPKLAPEVRQGKVLFSTPDEARRWYQGALAFEKRLEGFGPLFANDPALQFCFQAARRNLGDFDGPRKWYQQFAARQPDGPWRQAALAELWLSDRTGAPPKPVLTCRGTNSKPYLDGKLDDDCWRDARPVKLTSAAGDTQSRYPTEVRTTYDGEFLYLGIRCGHPDGEGLPEAAKRPRDADLRTRDRVSVLLDLDRDYATCFHFQVDASGSIVDECWGDRTWNPRWFMAIHREPGAWTVEMAIPLGVLTGDRVTPGRAWAANVVRVLPGKGVQAFSLPAEAPEQALRPEGLGLLMFAQPLSQAKR